MSVLLPLSEGESLSELIILDVIVKSLVGRGVERLVAFLVEFLKLFVLFLAFL